MIWFDTREAWQISTWLKSHGHIEAIFWHAASQTEGSLFPWLKGYATFASR